MHAAFTANGLDVIYLLAPTSTDERIRAVAERASGFVYCVSVTGITGVRDEVSPTWEAFVQRVREHISLPIAVGFGISQPKHFQAAGRVADAAVIGTAIIDEITESGPSERERRGLSTMRRWSPAGAEQLLRAARIRSQAIIGRVYRGSSRAGIFELR